MPSGERPHEERPATTDDAELVVALRRGDEEAFLALVERHHAALVRLATEYVRSPAIAEEVAQDTWLAVLEGIDRFEERSSLKTWLFRILTNRAKSRGERERRSVSFTDMIVAGAGPDEPAVDPERFLPAGHWSAAPRAWDVPEAQLLVAEVREEIHAAIAQLTAMQRQVITLRDVEGWGATEVCAVLGISDVNQRVLLHRARARVRAALEEYLDASARGAAPARTGEPAGLD